MQIFKFMCPENLMFHTHFDKIFVNFFYKCLINSLQMQKVEKSSSFHLTIFLFNNHRTILRTLILKQTLIFFKLSEWAKKLIKVRSKKSTQSTCSDIFEIIWKYFPVKTYNQRINILYNYTNKYVQFEFQ